MFNSLPCLLIASIALGLLHLLLAATLSTTSRGVKWSIGSRDGEPPPLTLHGDRAHRAARNFLETFPFFAAAVLCAIATSRDGYLPLLGAQLYFWARVAYLPLYLLGVSLLRSLAWGVALAGIVIVVVALC